MKPELKAANLDVIVGKNEANALSLLSCLLVETLQIFEQILDIVGTCERDLKRRVAG